MLHKPFTSHLKIQIEALESTIRQILVITHVESERESRKSTEVGLCRHVMGRKGKGRFV